MAPIQATSRTTTLIRSVLHTHCILHTLPAAHTHAQGRILNILSQTMRSYPADTAAQHEAHTKRVAAALFYQFRTAPDSIAIRRELLSSTRYMLSGPLKAVAFQDAVPDVLQEGVLLGSSLASMETLKPMAVRVGRGRAGR